MIYDLTLMKGLLNSLHIHGLQVVVYIFMVILNCWKCVIFSIFMDCRITYMIITNFLKSIRLTSFIISSQLSYMFMNWEAHCYNHECRLSCMLWNLFICHVLNEYLVRVDGHIIYEWCDDSMSYAHICIVVIEKCNKIYQPKIHY